MKYEIQPLVEADIDELYVLGCSEKDFSADGDENRFWPKETLLRLIQSKQDITLKLVVEGVIVGFSFTVFHNATKKAFIENFHVKKAFVDYADALLKKTYEYIEESGAEFIMYLYDTKDDSNSKDLFADNGYFFGNDHIWVHKNISFSNPVLKK